MPPEEMIQQQIAQSESNLKLLAKVAFDKYDVDNSGVLELNELARALAEMSTQEETSNLANVSRWMRKYDADNSGTIDFDEFRFLVRDLSTTGQLQLREEAQREVKVIKAAAAEQNPWISCLEVDRVVQDTLHQLRAQFGRNKTRRASRANAGGSDSARGDESFKSSDASFRRRWSITDAEVSQPSESGGAASTTLRGRLFARCKPCVSLVDSSCDRILPVMDPNGRFKVVWSLGIAVLICYCAITVPLEIAFQPSMVKTIGVEGWAMWETVNLALDIIFMVDVVLSFRTGFFSDGKLVTDSYRIARNYLRGAFFVDLLGSFPFNFFVGTSEDSSDAQTARLNRQLRLLRIAKLNRLLRLSKLSKYLKNVELMMRFNPSALRVLKLMLLMVCCCHWMGCLWWFVADVELSLTSAPTEPFNDWLPNAFLLQQGSLGEQFAAAFFWGAGMVTATIPYDIFPTTALEAFVTSACMFCGLLLNAFVIGSMASALSSLDSKKQMCRGRLETIGHYLLIHNVASELRAKILEYYEYRYTSSQSMEEMNLLRDLPPSLATRLALTINRRIVTSAPFFASLADGALLGVLQMLQPVIAAPDEVITVEGGALRAVHFIQKGRVRCSTHSDPEGREVDAGDSFGLEVVEDVLEYETSKSHASTNVTTTSTSNDDDAGSGNGGSGDAINRRALARAFAKETATAITYCDLMALELTELADLLSRESSWVTSGTYDGRGPKAKRLKRAATSLFRKSARCLGRASSGGATGGSSGSTPEHPVADCTGSGANGANNGANGANSSHATPPQSKWQQVIQERLRRASYDETSGASFRSRDQDLAVDASPEHAPPKGAGVPAPAAAPGASWFL